MIDTTLIQPAVGTQLYMEVAKAAAEYVHQGWFSAHWGVLPSDQHIKILFNNRGVGLHSPFASQFKELVEQNLTDCKLVGEADASDGYSFALVYLTPEVAYGYPLEALWQQHIRNSLLNAAA
jgi:hypothetical protein